MEALEDSTVYTSVLTAIGQLIAGQAALSAKHRGIFISVRSCRGNRCHPEKVYGFDIPDKLDEDEWLRLYAEYRMLRKTELEEFEIVMHNAFAKVVNRLFSKDNASDSMDIGTG